MAIIGALPVTLTNGTIADATQVMADFNYILTQVNANAAPITGGTLTGALTVGGGLTVQGSSITMSNAAGASLQLVSPNATYKQIVGYTGTTTAGSGLRWNMQLGDGVSEGGSNSGTNFGIQRYSDTGTFIDQPLSINRASGQATFSAAPIIATGAAATLILNKAAGAFNIAIMGQRAGLLRWQIQPGNNTAESAGSGSDFEIDRYNDAGTFIDAPLTITRSTGQTSFTGNGNVTINSPGHAVFVLNKAVGTFVNQITGSRNSVTRWVINPGNNTTETGSGNTGSDFQITNCNDAGTALGNAILISRATGVCTFSAAIVNGPSDRSLKENIAPLENALAKVMQLQGVSFNMIGDEDKRRQIGLIAQDVAPVVPEVIQDFRSTVPAADEKSEPTEIHKLALDYPKLTALLIEAVKTLTARVETLEAKLAT